MCAVPFLFKVVHPGRFLRHIQALRTSPLRRAALDVAAYTGASWVAMKTLALFTPSARRLPVCAVDLAAGFVPWADEVWECSRADYALVAGRDAATLERLYPASDPRFLRVRAAGGWAVVLDTQMQGHKQFGDMRVGTIVDCLAPQESAGAVIRAAAGLLEQRGVDLIVSNQLHGAWCTALVESGFRMGPSNYLLALSPALAAAAGGEKTRPQAWGGQSCPQPPLRRLFRVGGESRKPAESRLQPGLAAPQFGQDGCQHEKAGGTGLKPALFHFNRGDGDGPIHL
jgi:hypothetical protein